ncbi:hypothetical protein B0H66DRAFT_507312 [Apodospora peruviana]|uniref:Uncharacterized protein n=1 Tax=Apodospora peruviana TaxID=516989 RepID=A0AAE0IV42_9PEZI|nr:hypothetical protein B0H66DRAFT_507312 [Apodospora peruviana]
MVYISAFRWQTLLWALLSLAGRALSQQECTNVTISSAADADAIRKTCKTILGNLVFAETFTGTGTVSLDGIEIIQGNIWHEIDDIYKCKDSPDESPCSAKFTISSSTLRFVNGTLYFWGFDGLESLVLPNLNRVQGSFSLNHLYQLGTLDVTGLQYVENFQLSAQNLEKFSIDGLQEFTGPRNGHVSVFGDKLDNVDGLFMNNLDPWKNHSSGGSYDNWMQTGMGVSLNLPNIKTVTFGWRRVPSFRFNPPNPPAGVVFGGPNTTEMEIGEVRLGFGMAQVDRHKQVKKLAARSLEVREATDLQTLNVPFDSLGSLDVFSAPSLTTVTLPPEAENWNMSKLSILDCPQVNLTSEYSMRNDERIKTWYWPKSDFDNIAIQGKLSNEFFESFLAPPVPRVRGHFFVGDTTGNLDCGIFAKAQADSGNTTFPKNKVGCISRNENSGPRLGNHFGGGSPAWQVVLVGIAMMATTVL